MTAVEFVTILIITLFLIVCSFISGLTLAERFHKQAEEDKRYALEKQYLRIRANADADDPVGPYASRHKMQLPPEFEEHLRQNGRATVSINSDS